MAQRLLLQISFAAQVAHFFAILIPLPILYLLEMSLLSEIGMIQSVLA
jgi:hypothetical protein